ncbi:hypothetical protein [Trueperella pecoris]|uniref:Uncharacterized protein n=1 Tax=Trueperella pecoris TaxID=2733571 RepID=A0A7M1QWT2_9ACTO|nr:hypothetical protein [Trueperella pecoris]QOQ39042.1 hypothetical protein HLG82_06035 [Trueperella pecoris]QOR46326.1 hypothetical protein INS88_03740 [Trueperella pecoris]QTG76152.1 hypothetical protein J4179_03655 [Trueperella pecoris]
MHFILWPTLPQTPQGRPRAGALLTTLTDGSTSIQWFDPDILFYFQVWDRLDGVNGSRLEPDICLNDDGDISVAALHVPWAEDQLLGQYSVRDGRWIDEPDGSWADFTRRACSVLAEGLRAPKVDLPEGDVAIVKVHNYLTVHVNFGGTMYRLLEREVPRDDEYEPIYRLFGVLSEEYPALSHATVLVQDGRWIYWAPGTNAYTHPGGTAAPAWLGLVSAALSEHSQTS